MAIASTSAKGVCWLLAFTLISIIYEHESFFSCSQTTTARNILTISTILVPTANAFTAFNSVHRRSAIPTIRSKFGAFPPHYHHHRHNNLPPLHSTPFDISLYDDENDNPFFDALSPLACPPNTKLIIGLNKYSHDTSICAADATTGRVLFALSKERISRRKHHGGNVATIVESCLDQLELDLDCIVKVVSNNHHHRILTYMENDVGSMEWQTGLNINAGGESGYTDEENLLDGVGAESNIEMSHHLAHAYSAAAQCPFDSGLVVVMDGMGETYRTMKKAIEDGDERYVSDLLFEGEFECIPSDVDEKSKTSVYDWREAESAYEFTKDSEGISVKVRNEI